MNASEEKVGAMVQAARYAAGLTQEELAGLAGVSSRTIASIEANMVLRPHPSTIRGIARALKLDDQETRRLHLASRHVA